MMRLVTASCGIVFTKSIIASPNRAVRSSKSYTTPSSLGTFDAGTNRLAVSATETGGTRTYLRRIFATGAVAPIGTTNATVFKTSALQEIVNDQLKARVQANVQQAQAALDQATANYQQGKSDMELAHLTADRWKTEIAPLVKEMGRAIELASICGLGRSVPVPLRTVMNYFPADLAKHLGGRNGT
jgi:hypothetical protein